MYDVVPDAECDVNYKSLMTLTDRYIPGTIFSMYNVLCFAVELRGSSFALEFVFTLSAVNTVLPAFL